RALEGCQAEGRSDQGWLTEGRAGNRVRRGRLGSLPRDTRLREVDSSVEGDGRKCANRLADERTAAAALERLSGAHRRAWMDLDLLDEARDVDQRGDQALRRLLGQIRIPHPARKVSLGRSLH